MLGIGHSAPGWMGAVSLSSDADDKNEEVMEEKWTWRDLSTHKSCLVVGKWMRDVHQRKMIIQVG